jgi:hypothetical protein
VDVLKISIETSPKRKLNEIKSRKKGGEEEEKLNIDILKASIKMALTLQSVLNS